MMRHTIMTTLLVFGIMLANQASAKIYQCTVDGTTQFQDTPCSADEDMELRNTSSNNSLRACYHVTERHGRRSQIQDFWTSKQQAQSMVPQSSRPPISPRSLPVASREPAVMHTAQREPCSHDAQIAQQPISLADGAMRRG